MLRATAVMAGDRVQWHKQWGTVMAVRVSQHSLCIVLMPTHEDDTLEPTTITVAKDTQLCVNYDMLEFYDPNNLPEEKNR